MMMKTVQTIDLVTPLRAKERPNKKKKSQTEKTHIWFHYQFKKGKLS